MSSYGSYGGSYDDSYGGSYDDSYGGSYDDSYGGSYDDSYGGSRGSYDDSYGGSYDDSYGGSYDDSYGGSYDDSYGGSYSGYGSSYDGSSSGGSSSGGSNGRYSSSSSGGSSDDSYSGSDSGSGSSIGAFSGSQGSRRGRSAGSPSYYGYDSSKGSYGGSYGSSYGDSYGGSYGDSYGGSYGSSYGGSYGDSYGGSYGDSYGGSYGGSYDASSGYPDYDSYHDGNRPESSDEGSEDDEGEAWKASLRGKKSVLSKCRDSMLETQTSYMCAVDHLRTAFNLPTNKRRNWLFYDGPDSGRSSDSESTIFSDSDEDVYLPAHQPVPTPVNPLTSAGGIASAWGDMKGTMPWEVPRKGLVPSLPKDLEFEFEQGQNVWSVGENVGPVWNGASGGYWLRGGNNLRGHAASGQWGNGPAISGSEDWLRATRFGVAGERWFKGQAAVMPQEGHEYQLKRLLPAKYSESAASSTVVIRPRDKGPTRQRGRGRARRKAFSDNGGSMHHRSRQSVRDSQNGGSVPLMPERERRSRSDMRDSRRSRFPRRHQRSRGSPSQLGYRGAGLNCDPVLGGRRPLPMPRPRLVGRRSPFPFGPGSGGRRPPFRRGPGHGGRRPSFLSGPTPRPRRTPAMYRSPGAGGRKPSSRVASYADGRGAAVRHPVPGLSDKGRSGMGLEGGISGKRTPIHAVSGPSSRKPPFPFRPGLDGSRIVSSRFGPVSAFDDQAARGFNLRPMRSKKTTPSHPSGRKSIHFGGGGDKNRRNDQEDRLVHRDRLPFCVSTKRKCSGPSKKDRSVEVSVSSDRFPAIKKNDTPRRNKTPTRGNPGPRDVIKKNDTPRRNKTPTRSNPGPKVAIVKPGGPRPRIGRFSHRHKRCVDTNDASSKDFTVGTLLARAPRRALNGHIEKGEEPTWTPPAQTCDGSRQSTRPPAALSECKTEGERGIWMYMPSRLKVD